MKTDSNNRMTVYSASAGSGKTFTLAVSYIKLLIENPKAYQTTLAVTFTNKATDEMKQRILSQLYALWHQLPSSKDYMERITSDLGCTPEHVSRQSQLALRELIHDYNRFNIETIDAFFQQVLRNLARELNLTANLRVELNDKEVESKAVDQLMEQLSEDRELFAWVMEFVRQNIGEEKSWNITTNIKEFGKAIFTDEYKSKAEAFELLHQDKNFFPEFVKRVHAYKANQGKGLSDIADEFFAVTKENGYTASDMYQGSKGPYGVFEKLYKGDFTKELGNSYVKTVLTDHTKLMKKKSNDPYADKKDAFARDVVIPLLERALKEHKEAAMAVETANQSLKSIYELRLLGDIQRRVNAINEGMNQFLLSNTQTMLNDLMQDSDAPFVFEKVGGQMRHIMIDEFQDTSVVQWANFRKLLYNVMAHEESSNLIVGDVKQSIYRWRNGDWSLLGNIEKDPLFTTKPNLETLSINYRSQLNIINFNNAFFLKAVHAEAEKLKTMGIEDAHVIEQMYSLKNLVQSAPEKKRKNPAKGLVDFRLLPKNSTHDQMLMVVQDHVETLLKAGAKPSSIAIVARGNEALSSIAVHLQKAFPDIRFISDEAFRLNASVAVSMIIAALRVIIDNNNMFARAELAKRYRHEVLGENIDTIQMNPKTDKDIDPIERIALQRAAIDKFLPAVFIERRLQLSTMPLIDMVEDVYEMFGLEQFANEGAYITEFLDSLNAFSQKNIPDVNRFLAYWDTTLNSQAVHGSLLDGIRLVTIHKSKGLEFDNLIVPFCDWELDKGSTLWCSLDKEPFASLPAVPLASRSIEKTFFSDEYYAEKLQVAIDNMNLLYVAFTRAGNNLFVIGRDTTPKEGKPGTHRSVLLAKILPTLTSLEGVDKEEQPYIEAIADAVISEEPFDCEGESTEEGKETFVKLLYGSLYIPEDTEKSDEDMGKNVFTSVSSSIDVDMCKSKERVAFRQSNGSHEFVSELLFTKEQQEQRHYLRQGTILHRILSLIDSADDVDRVVNRFLNEGVLSSFDDQLNPKAMSRLLTERVRNNKDERVNRWFSPDVKVFNECTILRRDPRTGLVRAPRPDRVVLDGDKITVIDFKFGNHESNYEGQVRNYMEHLREMGYTNVDGFLWYVYRNEIVPVV